MDSYETSDHAPALPKAAKRSVRTSIVLGAGAAVLAVGGAFGVHAASQPTASDTAAPTFRLDPVEAEVSDGAAAEQPASVQPAVQRAITGDAQARRGPDGPRRGDGTFGTLSKVDGSTLTVTAPDNQTVTVLTNSSTDVRKDVAGKVSDIKVGDFIMAKGTASGTDTVAAERIHDRGSQEPPAPPDKPAGAPANADHPGPPPGDRPAGFAGGKVTAIDGGTLTVTGRDDKVTKVTTTDATVVTLTKVVPVSELTVGQPIMAMGARDANGAVTATVVHQPMPGEGGPGGPGGPGWHHGPGGGPRPGGDPNRTTSSSSQSS